MATRREKGQHSGGNEHFGGYKDNTMGQKGNTAEGQAQKGNTAEGQAKKA